MMLIPMLAQAETVPSEFLKNFLMIVAAVAASAYYIKVLFWGEGQKTPQPFEVRAAKDYVHKEEFNTLVQSNEAAHRDMFSKIGGVERGSRQQLESKFEAIQRSQEEGREKLHDRINDVLEAVSELRGTVNEMRKQ